jgi:tRNA pseudouridine55 synthase
MHPNDKTTPNALHSGLLPIYKPTNWTSSDVVAYVRKTLEFEARDRLGTKKRPKIKVGHGGTLDPLAEGVLVLGVGKGTKMMTDYLKGAKSYEAKAEMGYETTTLDLDGNIVKRSDPAGITLENIKSVSDNYVGEILQVPPIYSALRKNGKRLYELAREGATEEDLDALGIPARPVVVNSLEVKPSDQGLPFFNLSVSCGGGTYIRSLIRDIGTSLGTHATMTHLVRTQQGPFIIDDCLDVKSNALELYAKILECDKVLEAMQGEVEGEEEGQ